MAKNKSGSTAFGAAATRLVEQYEPEPTRLFTDPVLKYIVQWPVPLLFRFHAIRNWLMKVMNRQTKGIYGAQICRTRYIDDALHAALKAGITQVVILGAGLDTRAYRIEGMKKIKTFEVDLPEVQAYKKKKVKKHFRQLPPNVVYVPINFNSETLDKVLDSTGLNKSQPVFFIWEGVTQYITAKAVDATLQFISGTAKGSKLVFTYILESVISRQSGIEGANELMDFFKKRNMEWLFGLNPGEVPKFLGKFNLSVIEDVGNSWYQKNYLAPIGRKLDITEMERIIYASLPG